MEGADDTVEYADAVLKCLDMKREWKRERQDDLGPRLHLSAESDTCASSARRSVNLQDAFDDLTGETLDADLVKEGCREDMSMLRKIGV